MLYCICFSGSNNQTTKDFLLMILYLRMYIHMESMYVAALQNRYITQSGIWDVTWYT